MSYRPLAWGLSKGIETPGTEEKVTEGNDMTQSKAEGFSISKERFAAILSSVGARSRTLAEFTYPDPPDTTIETERAAILSLGNEIREKLLIIDTRLNVLYDAELP